MKKTTYLILLSACFFSIGYAQSVKVNKNIENNIKLLLSSTDTVITKRNLYIMVNLFKINNPPGSAMMPETEEITNKYFISISSTDTSPDINVYEMGDFLLPKLIAFELIKDNCHLVIEYGIAKKRKKVDFSLTIKDIVMKNL